MVTTYIVNMEVFIIFESQIFIKEIVIATTFMVEIHKLYFCNYSVVFKIYSKSLYLFLKRVGLVDTNLSKIRLWCNEQNKER